MKVMSSNFQILVQMCHKQQLELPPSYHSHPPAHVTSHLHTFFFSPTAHPCPSLASISPSRDADVNLTRCRTYLDPPHHGMPSHSTAMPVLQSPRPYHHLLLFLLYNILAATANFLSASELNPTPTTCQDIPTVSYRNPLHTDRC